MAAHVIALPAACLAQHVPCCWLLPACIEIQATFPHPACCLHPLTRQTAHHPLLAAWPTCVRAWLLDRCSWSWLLWAGTCAPPPAQQHQRAIGVGAPIVPVQQHTATGNTSRCIPLHRHTTPTCVLARCTQDSGSCWAVCQMLLCRRRCTHLQMTAHTGTQPQLAFGAVWWEDGGGGGKVAAAPHGVDTPSVPAVPGCQQQKALWPACRQLMLLQSSHSIQRDGPIGGQGHSQSMQMYAVLAAVLLLLRAKTCRLVRDLGPRTAGLLAARNGCTLSEEEAILACYQHPRCV